MARTLFTGGVVVDGTGAPPTAADVVVEADRIVAVGPGLDGDHVVDCTGAAVLPGLFDCHVHVLIEPPLDMATLAATSFSLPYYQAVHNLRRTLEVGITTVRDLGGADLGVKEAQSRGLIAGPRLQVAITLISQTGGHGDDWHVCGAELPYLFLPSPGRPAAVADGPDELRRKVRELVRAGADVIKVATSGGVMSPRSDPRHGHYRDDELAALVAEASAAGRFVAAHAQATDGIKGAVRAGIRSIEHGIYLDDEAIAMMLERGTFLVPTLMAPRGLIEAAEAGVPVPPYVLDKTRMVLEAHASSFRRAVDAGVKVAMGTDSGVTPHGRNLEELRLMVAEGMDPLDVLTAATGRAAELLGVADDRGALEPGKRADLLVLAGDPLDLEGLAARVRGVWQDGRQVAPGDAT